VAKRALDLLFLLTAAALASAAAAQGVETRPFETTEQNPFAQIYGLPSIGPARVLAAGDSEWRASADLANYYAFDSRNAEQITVDGETRRYVLAMRRGAGDGMEWGFELPYVRQSGGGLDHFIERWHDWGGFPNGGRELAPRDRLLIEYRRNGVPLVRLQDPGEGPGDVKLFAARRLASDAPDLALRAALKLPTGDSAGLRGSGAADAALWLSAACGSTQCRGAFAWYGGAGLLVAGRGDILPQQQRRLIPFAGFGVMWRVTQDFAFKAEVNGHDAFYRDSALRELNSAAQGLFGGSWRLGRAHSLDFAIAEDLKVSSVPDVQFHFAWRATY
jgi:hypothetical protein